MVTRISGPIVTAAGMRGAQMYEVVHVGELGLVGEVVRLIGDRATIQVYEDTTMLKPGAPVHRTGAPLSVWLGPGLIGNIYDGIQRPLPGIQARSGAWIRRGEKVEPLDTDAALALRAAGRGRRGGRRRAGHRRGAGDAAGRAPHHGPAGRVRARVRSVVATGEYTLQRHGGGHRDRRPARAS